MGRSRVRDIQLETAAAEGGDRAHIGGPVSAYGLWRDLRKDEEYPLMV
ncbi:hypothetical protein [Mesorhizobium sp. 43Arga]